MEFWQHFEYDIWLDSHYKRAPSKENINFVALQNNFSRLLWETIKLVNPLGDVCDLFEELQDRIFSKCRKYSQKHWKHSQWNFNMREVHWKTKLTGFSKTVNFYNSCNKMLHFFLARERPASTDMQRFARKRTVCGEQISVYLFTALFLIDNSSRTQFFSAEKQSADRGFHNKKLKSTFIQEAFLV